MDITTLGVALDTSDLKQGESALNGAADAANKAADAMDSAGGSASRMASSYSGLGDAAQRAASSLDPYLTALQQEYDLLGLSRAETEAYIARARGMSDAEQQLAAALGGKIDAWNREEDAARRAAAAEEAVIASGQRFLANLQQQAETVGMSGAELAAYQAKLKGLTDAQVQQASAFAAKIDAWKADAAAASAATDAQNRAAQAAQKYLGTLQREADLLGATSTEKEAYIAKEKGLSAAEQQVAVSLRAQIDAFNQSAAAARAEAAAKDQATKAADAFIARLEQEVSQIGKTRAEILQMQAAQLGVSQAADPLIARINSAGEATHGFGLKTSAARREVIVLAHEMATGNWSRFGGSMMVLGEQMDILSKLMSPLGLAIGAVVGAIAGSAVITLHAAESLSQYGHSVEVLSQQTGLSTAEVQKWGFAAEAFGVSAKDAAKAISTFDSAQNKALHGNKDAEAAFKSLGISMADLKKNSPNELLNEVSDAFARSADGAGKAAVAHLLFGTAATELLPLLNKGSEGLHELGMAADETGAIMQDSTIKQLDALAERFDTSKAKMEAMNRSAKLELLPTIIAITDAFGDNAAMGPMLHEFYSGVAEVAKYAATGLAAIVTAAREAGAAISMVASIANRAGAGDLSGIGGAFKSGIQDMSNAQSQYQSFIDKLWAGPQASPQGPPRSAMPRPQIDFSKGHNGPGRQRAGNDNAVNADLADLQNQQRMIEDALKSSLEHIKALRQQGVIDEKDAIAQSYAAEQTALQQRIDIDQQQLEIAKGKKNSDAYRKYSDDIARLQAQMLNNYQKFGDEVATYDAKQAAALKAYSDSLAEQLSTQQLAANTKLVGLSLGGVDKGEYETQIKLLEDYDKKVSSLTKSLTENRIDRTQYDAELKATQDFYAQSVAVAVQSSNQIKAANGSWEIGAVRAVQNYADQAANVATSTANVFENAFKSMEDALANFATTGKLNFGSLVDSIIADIVRMQARAAISGILGSLMPAVSGFASDAFGMSVGGTYGPQTQAGLDNLIGSNGGWGTIAGTRANGGDVGAGQTYLVGESGPELFRSQGGGTIVPNNAIGGGGKTEVNVHLVEDSSKGGQFEQKQNDSGGVDIMAYVAKIAQQAVAGQIASGQGDVSKALSQRFGLTPRFR